MAKKRRVILDTCDNETLITFLIIENNNLDIHCHPSEKTLPEAQQTQANPWRSVGEISTNKCQHSQVEDLATMWHNLHCF